MTTRVAGTADATAMAALRAAWVGGAPAPEGFADRLAAWLAEEAGHRTTWLAEVDGEPVGMVSLLEYRRMPRPDVADGRWGYVGHLFVREEHRRAGIASALLLRVVELARARGHVRLVVAPSAEARPVFARCGFVAAGDELLVRTG